MKILILFISIFTMSNAVANDFIGQFKGKEKVVITCDNASWNKSETRDWETTHSDLKDDTFKTLTKTGGGTYKGEATIKGNTATGNFKGKDGFGNVCNGEFTDNLSGDALTVKVSGSCPAVKCTFTGDVSATKQ